MGVSYADELKERFEPLEAAAYDALLDKGRENTSTFLKGVDLMQRIPGRKYQGLYLMTNYRFFRTIDDIVDKDIPLPEGYGDAVEYVQARLDFLSGIYTSNKLPDPGTLEPIDAWLMYSLVVGQRFGQDFSEEIADLLGSLLFDAKRVGTYTVFPESELRQHFYLLDIRGTIKAALKVYNEAADEYRRLLPLGSASRIYYDVRDLHEDIVAGYINISQEAISALGITDEMLADTLTLGQNHKMRSDAIRQDYADTNQMKKRLQLITDEFYQQLPFNVRRWVMLRIIEGTSLLSQHRREIGKSPFGFLARLTFPLAYVRPAEKYFNRVTALLKH